MRQPLAMIALRGERAIVDDLLQQIRHGELGADAIPLFPDYPWWERSFTNRRTLRDNQANLLWFHSQAVEIGKLPEADQIERMKALSERWGARARSWGFMESSGHLTECLLLGHVNGIPIRFGMNQARLRTVIAVLATERYRLEHGHWPEPLDQLVPAYLATVPADPFAKGLLKLRRFADCLVIYSIDYDQHDDGGRIGWKHRMSGNADTGIRL